MSGLFDFLGKINPGDFSLDQPMPTQAIQPGMPQAVPQEMAGALQTQAAPQVQQPGFLARLAMPDETGVSKLDRIGAIGRSMQDGSDGSIDTALRTKQQDYQKQQQLKQAQADRAAKNAAFKAAYKGGKFDPGVYAANLGTSDVDPSDIAALTKAFAPKNHVVSNAHGIYNVDEDTGDMAALKEFGPEALKGWTQNADGSWSPVRGGPYDPDVIRANATTRRKVVTSNPMPRAAGAGAATGLPPGYVSR